MHLSRYDPRSDREILLSIERKLEKLIEEQDMADIFDRIIAGIAALQAGDTTALQQHVAAIDSHLSDVDSEVLGLQTDDTSGKARLDAIEAGLGKVADAVSPASSGGSTAGSGTSANPGGGAVQQPSGSGNPGGSADQGAVAGSGDHAGNPGGAPADNTTGSPAGTPQPGGIPTSGPGSETTASDATP